MIRKILLALALSTCVPALADAPPPADNLSTPPADAKIWTISSSGGTAHHGQIALWTDANGIHWSRMSFNLRGFVTEIDEQNHFAADGTIDSIVVRGHTPSGDAAETYAVAHQSDNTVLDATASTFTSRAAALDHLSQAVAADPGLAGQLHVLPGFEVVSA